MKSKRKEVNFRTSQSTDFWHNGQAVKSSRFLVGLFHNGVVIWFYETLKYAESETNECMNLDDLLHADSHALMVG